MVNPIAVLAALLIAPSAMGAMWTVCVDDSASLLNTPMRGAVLKEFQSVMGGHGSRLDFQDCRSGEQKIELSIDKEPPAEFDGVLGWVRRRDGRIEPRLHVFYGPLVRYIGEPNNAQAVGRAIARVAAHEAMHFLDQQPEHCGHGLLRSAFAAYELAADNPRPFRYAGHCLAAPSPTAVIATRNRDEDGRKAGQQTPLRPSHPAVPVPSGLADDARQVPVE